MVENRLFEALLDVIPFGAYAVDIETYEVVYANKTIRDKIQTTSTFCWESIFSQPQVCPWCTISKLKSRTKTKDNYEKLTCDFFDESHDIWQKSYDELVSWPDGRDVKYSILVDITDQKEIQGTMIKSHANLAIKTNLLQKTNENLEKTKQDLQNAVNEFEQLLNASLEGMLIVKNGKCIDANTQILKLLNIKNKDEIIDKDFKDFIYETYEKESEYILVNTNQQFQTQMRKTDNSFFPVLIQNKPLSSKDANVISIVDLSELKNKDRLLQEQKKMASLGEMMTNIAHHWRQPLNSISISASTLELEKEIDTLSDESFLKHINNIKENSFNLSNTIDEFRNLVDTNKTRKHFDINSSIQKTLKFFESKIDDNSIKVINETTTIMVYSYLEEFYKVLLNILNNSKDALEKKPLDERYILITNEIEKDYIKLNVIDSGGGIKEEIMDKIFEPYFTTKHKYSGTGLGLYLVHNILEDIGASISVENKNFEIENKNFTGACFTITFYKNKDFDYTL